MIQFLTECSMCKSNAVFSVIYVVKQILQIVFVLVPIILIVLVTIDLAKNVVAGKEDDMKKNKNIAIKRIIYAIAIFFVPAIVNLLMNVIYRTTDENSESSFSKCWTYATKENVSKCNEEAQAKQKEEDNARKQKSDKAMSDYKNKVEEQENSREKQLGEKEEEENNQNNNSNKNLPSTLGNYTVYVGDSRTNLFCYNNNFAPLGGGSNNDNVKCIVAPGYGYNWFYPIGKDKIKKELDAHSDANIVLESMGTNDISPKYSSNGDPNEPGIRYSNLYASHYKELANSYPKAKFIVVSLTYFEESKEDSIEYKLTKSIADNFNNSMESLVSEVSNIVYCDINKALGNSYKYSKDDGIHYYEPSDNKRILEEINKCI